jgi:hypothetical protein
MLCGLTHLSRLRKFHVLCVDVSLRDGWLPKSGFQIRDAMALLGFKVESVFLLRAPVHVAPTRLRNTSYSDFKSKRATYLLSNC